MSVRGARVLITGATRGMGRLFALRAAADGARHLVLWGRDTTALEQVAQEADRAGLTVRTAQVDLSDPAALDAAAATLLEDGLVPDVLVNNAGVVSSNAYAWQSAPEDAERTLAVNTAAPIRLTTRLLPAMLDDGGRPKRILTVASASGLLPVPRMAAYAASKAAVLHWSDSLRLELAQAGHDHVTVTTYSPSYVDTGMFAGARAPLLTPLLSPERAVELAWRGLLAGRPHVVAPASVHLARVLRAVLPTGGFDRVAHLMGVHGSMAGFTGRGAGAQSSGR
ncbi:SDR family NAD(P)-dependent oxidoreductase [Georgenia alba]|uniref:SDR family NAD(P)-dependent oxidoreductase n=1 Tax=Georgenia alba TaxID=2233858 RepID=A0ABW2Q894_9MICO